MADSYDYADVYDLDDDYDEGGPTIAVPTHSNLVRARPSIAAASQSPTRASWKVAQSRESAVRMPAADIVSMSYTFTAAWKLQSHRQSDIRMRPSNPVTHESIIRALWDRLTAKSRDTRLPIDDAHACSSAVRMPCDRVGAKQSDYRVPWHAGSPRVDQLEVVWPGAHAKSAYVRIRWKPGYPYRSGYTIPIPGEPDIPPGTTIVIPSEDAYFMIPALSILRTSDAADLNAIDASVSLDMSSYAWTLSATIPRQTLALVDPNANSEPVSVNVAINGYNWTFLIEGYTDNRKFGGTGCKIRGRSQSAILGAPYAPLATFTNATNEDASQLANDLMPLGWTCTWSTQDWLVPAALFSYADLAPIDALAQLVNAVGGSILPDQALQSLTVQPMYPTSPWNWPAATPYADLPSSFIVELSGQWEGNFKTAYNGVYVSGQNSGVVGLVKLTGTAGDVLLPTVTDQLLCVQAANVERGRIELAKADKKKTETIRVPLLPPGGSGNPGVFQPGQLIQITEPSSWAPAAWRGQVMSVQIDATHSAAPGSTLSVRQTLAVERHA